MLRHIKILKITISSDPATVGQDAARLGAELLRRALRERESTAIIVATGASQFSMLEALVHEPDLAWERVTIFHLDEYVGLPITHRASFRGYLWERFHRRLPIPPRAFHYIDGMSDPVKECKRLEALIGTHTIDVCFAGIGENAHLAFNDPPADFQCDRAYLLTRLDEACRRQQWKEGWFSSLQAVPEQAISMSIRQILRSKSIVLTVPDERKAAAVQKSVEGPVTPDVPASILQRHPDAALFLDPPAATLLHAASLGKQAGS
jgi:glucosamine-6-phosphate deaminase